NNLGMRFQFEPRATRLDEDGSELPEPDPDDWILSQILGETVHFQNVRDSVVAKIGKDCIYDYRSDRPRDVGEGPKHGIAVLKVHVFIRGVDISLRANARPGERVDTGRQIAASWTPYRPMDISAFVPQLAKSVRLQVRITTDRRNVPLL